MADHNHMNHLSQGRNGDDMHMEMHAMNFHFGSEETILFSFWKTSSAFGIIVSCFIVLIGCVLLESIRWFRAHRNFTQTASNLAAQANGRRP